jgi:sec-independent protein translocase protein TatB
MFDVSFWELLIIGAIALVVVGPERLPRSIRDEVEREVNAEGLRETQKALKRQARETEKTVSDAVETPASTVKSAAKEATDADRPRTGTDGEQS